MSRFCFVHAADLHLDTPFACARADATLLASALRESTFQAWETVVSTCVEKRAAFLLVAGDVFDASQKSLRAQIRFRNGLECLDRHSIPVFVAHGNHDPLDSLSASLPPPPNTYVFGSKVETREVRRDGQLLALVTGISHPQKNESRNLTTLFPSAPRRADTEVFLVALLHCNVGAETGHDPYAPCELDDLANAGYHYWALGHAHERRVLCRSPWIVYPGNTQGRSLRELGPRGCLLIEVEGSEVLAEPALVETDAVRWFSCEVDAEQFSDTQGLLEGLLSECRKLQQGSVGRPVMARLVVRGRTHLYRELRRPGHAADLAEAVRERTAAWTPFVGLAALDLAVRPPIDLDALRLVRNFLGELLRASEELSREDCLRVWEPLLEDSRFNRFKLRSALEGLEWQDLVMEARYLCADLLLPGDSE